MNVGLLYCIRGRLADNKSRSRLRRSPEPAPHHNHLWQERHVMATNIVAAVRAVLYLRMSTEDQENSIEPQRVELTKYAKKHGYQIIGEYVDEAISGDATEKRTGFQAMRDDVESGEFSVVLCWDQDRFGRFDPLDAGYWIFPFRRAGVRLETIAQGKIDWEDLTGQLVYSVNQLGKAQFLRDLSRNTTRGLIAAARDGRGGTGGRSCYGYRSKDGEVWIVEEEAEVVRLIFQLYLKPDGSLRGIAGELNRRGISPASSKVWRMSTVRSILSRRKYTGTFVFGEQNGGRYFAMKDGEILPRTKSDKTVSSTPIIHENRFEAIVDQDTFDRVQVKLSSRKRKTAPRSARQYVLSGLCTCGDCGGSMGGLTKRSKSTYRCRTYHQSGSGSCYNITIPEAPLVDCIVGKIQDRYLSEAALDRLRRKLEEEQARSKPRPKDLARLRREIETLDRKVDNAEEAVLDAPANSRAGLYRKLEQFNSDRDRLKAELQSLTSRQATVNRKDGSEIDQAIEALQRLREAFNEARPEDRKELLSTVVSRIELNFDHGETKAGRKTSVFSHGTIYVKPDAGAGAVGLNGSGSNCSKSTQLIKTGPLSETDTASGAIHPLAGVFRRHGVSQAALHELRQPAPACQSRAGKGIAENLSDRRHQS